MATVVQQLVQARAECEALRAEVDAMKAGRPASAVTVTAACSEASRVELATLRAENMVLKARAVLKTNDTAALIAKLSGPGYRPSDAECIELYQYYQTADQNARKVVHNSVVNWQTWVTRGLRIDEETKKQASK